MTKTDPNFTIEKKKGK